MIIDLVKLNEYLRRMGHTAHFGQIVSINTQPVPGVASDHIEIHFEWGQRRIFERYGETWMKVS